MKEEEGAFPEACSLGVEMRVALQWRSLKEHCATAWCSWGLRTEVYREDCWEGKRRSEDGWQDGRLSLGGKGCASFISQD